MPLVPVKDTAADLGSTIVEATLANRGQASVGGGLVLMSLLFATYAEAQPVPVDPGMLDVVVQSATTGSPWAMVVMALVLVSSQVAAALRDWSKARQAKTEQLGALLDGARQELLDREGRLARAEARLEILEEDRAARSGEHVPPE